jgi:hypothetical protein
MMLPCTAQRAVGTGKTVTRQSANDPPLASAAVMPTADAVNPAVSTTAPAPTAIPAWFTSTTCPLLCKVPNNADGVLVTTRLIDVLVPRWAARSAWNAASGNGKALPVDGTVVGACTVLGGHPQIGWAGWRQTWPGHEWPPRPADWPAPATRHHNTPAPPPAPGVSTPRQALQRRQWHARAPQPVGAHQGWWHVPPTSTRSMPPLVGALHILGHPVLAQDLVGHLDHDVVGLQQAVLQVVARSASGPAGSSGSW